MTQGNFSLLRPCATFLCDTAGRFWQAARILGLRPWSLYWCGLAVLQRHATRREKTAEIRFLSPLRLPFRHAGVLLDTSNL